MYMKDRITRLTEDALTLLERWADAVERYWFDVDAERGIGCYGPGYIHWGIQSNFNYASAMATLAVSGNGSSRSLRLDRAKAALRFAAASHLTGDRTGLAGKKWGNSWISMLGIERGMHGISLLAPHLPDEDRDRLKRMLVSEADWVLNDASRGGRKGVCAGMWNHDGNVPESNVWWAALLWRVSRMFPEEGNAPLWAERAHDYFVNGVSVPADSENDDDAAGKTVRERYRGPNFFPHYALDHHGYLNVGYAFICMSNAAMLHFDLKIAGQERPATLDHHQEDLWRVIRHFVFDDGRLARIGGDSRVRYAYCQEYLLPSLLYAADRFGAEEALPLASAQIELMKKEAEDAEGLFYGSRLDTMRRENPHYYTRLESDRACVLSQFVDYAPRVQWPADAGTADDAPWSWEEPEHGAVCVRSPERFASFSWRAFGVAQAHCLPPDRGDLAEWYMNLTPDIRFIGDGAGDRRGHRRVLARHTELLRDGFVTCGSVMEGVDVSIDEGGHVTDQATTCIAFAALTDGRTCLGLQYAETSPDRSVFTSVVKALHLNLPNDFHNGYRRSVGTAGGTLVLASPADRDEVIETESAWLNVDDVLGVVGIYGGTLRIDRKTRPRGGKYENLRTEEICMDVQRGAVRRGYGEVIVDCGFAVLSRADAETTASFRAEKLTFDREKVRGVKAVGLDEREYALVANFSDREVSLPVFGRDVVLRPGRGTVVQS